MERCHVSSDTKTQLPVPSPATSGAPWGVLGLVTAAQVSTAFISLGVASLIPFLVSGLNLSAAEAGLVGGAVNVGMTPTGFLAGRLTDIYGEKRILILACLGTGLAIALSSLSASFSSLYFLLIFTGFWAGAVTPAASRAITNWFGSSGLGFAQSVRQSGITVGGFLAALILPRLAMMANWHVALISAGVSGVLGASLVQCLYREPRRNVGAGPGRSTDGRTNGGLRHLVRGRNIWLVCFMGLLFVGGQFSLLTYLQLYLKDKAGISLHLASIFLSLVILAGVLGRIFWGALSDRAFHGARRPVLTVIGGCAAAMALGMLLISRFTPLWLLALMTFILGFTAMGWNGVYVTLLSELPGDRNNSATTVGIGISFMQLGVLIIPPSFGFLVDVRHNYQISWILLSCVMLAGTILIRGVHERTRSSIVE
ncbi:putative sulfoacetate transporter SauU [Peptococcaceae bacterium CEB3]|nr:putative sulfoacetate transporter SauU [Peptococcaceae bacterium CEB3]